MYSCRCLDAEETCLEARNCCGWMLGIWFLCLQRQFRAKANYIQKQPDITTNMRSILVDWMVEVSEEYQLQRESLFLAVNYIDRFLSHMSVLRGKLQLVGAASMFLAS